MLEVEKFIQEHKEENWLELLTQKPYCLKYNEDEDYVLLKYDMIESDFTQPIVKECRGLIIDKRTLIPKALSFFKFFNIQEPLHDEIDWRSARTQEKVDGAKILLWFNEYKNKWQISTSGMLDSFKAPINDIGETYGDLFVEALKGINLTLDEFFTAFKPTYCYTFELVSPKARIVVPYKETKLYFIGLRDVGTFIELDPEIEEDVIKLGIPRPKQYPLTSLEECMQATEKMGFDEEGFVVVDKDWHRVKIKSKEYILAHFTRFNNGTSYSRILEMIENKTDESFLKIYPEYTKTFDEVREKYNDFKGKIKQGIKNIKDNLGDIGELERKVVANYILQTNKDISAFLFRYIDTKIEDFDLFIDEEWRKLTKGKKLKYLGYKEEKDADKFREE